MARADLLAGTRPDINSKVIMTASDGFDGYEITEYKGMCWGISIRAKDLGQDCLMGCKTFTGGELSSYAELGDESRQKAIDRMLEMASQLGANGIIDFRFDMETGTQGAIEVTAHGTAVVVKPVKNYVPTGAIGNILLEMSQGGFGGSAGGVDQMGNLMNSAPSGETSHKYEVVRLQEKDGKYFAKCPQCSAVYNVTSIISDSAHDYDLEEYGQQVKCRKCESIFTLPEV